MREIICASIVLAILTVIAVVMIVSDKRKNRLPEDDGIVWNPQIQKRLEQKKK